MEIGGLTGRRKLGARRVRRLGGSYRSTFSAVVMHSTNETQQDRHGRTPKPPLLLKPTEPAFNAAVRQHRRAEPYRREVEPAAGSVLLTRDRPRAYGARNVEYPRQRHRPSSRRTKLPERCRRDSLHATMNAGNILSRIAVADARRRRRHGSPSTSAEAAGPASFGFGSSGSVKPAEEVGGMNILPVARGCTASRSMFDERPARRHGSRSSSSRRSALSAGGAAQKRSGEGAALLPRKSRSVGVPTFIAPVSGYWRAPGYLARVNRHLPPSRRRQRVCAGEMAKPSGEIAVARGGKFTSKAS